MARDEFLVRDKQVIASRVAWQCSFPGCNAMTVGPTEDSTQHFNIGVACHIAAASPGGARYDAGMTKAQRTHPENGIWMCATHSKEIDNDPTAYTKDLLIHWKREAEDRARRRLGKATRVDTVSPEIVAVSQAWVYGSKSIANLEDGRHFCSAIAYDFNAVDPTSYATGAFVLRFAIAKPDDQKSITLFEIKAVVYEYEPLPGLLAPALSAYPHIVYPYLLTLRRPANSRPLPCVATHFCPPGQSRMVPFAPLLIDDENPVIIDVRFTAKTPGIYQFSLDAVIMRGVEFQTFRVMSPCGVLFEAQEDEFDPLLGV